MGKKPLFKATVEFTDLEQATEIIEYLEKKGVKVSWDLEGMDDEVVDVVRGHRRGRANVKPPVR